MNKKTPRYLPANWVCIQCGETASDTARVCKLYEMDADERDALLEYGKCYDQFFDGETVQICGNCGMSHWTAPENIIAKKDSPF